MGRNIEIKARANDPDAQRARAEALADRPRRTFDQHDVFFRTPRGRLKLRRQTGRPAELIAYARADDDRAAASSYELVPAPDPDALQRALAGTLGVRGEVVKTRTLLMRGRTRIHLDSVEGLGHFLELEVVLGPDDDDDEGRAEADRISAELGIEASDRIAGAYIDLVEQRRERSAK